MFDDPLCLVPCAGIVVVGVHRLGLKLKELDRVVGEGEDNNEDDVAEPLKHTRLRIESYNWSDFLTKISHRLMYKIEFYGFTAILF